MAALNSHGIHNSVDFAVWLCCTSITRCTSSSSCIVLHQYNFCMLLEENIVITHEILKNNDWHYVNLLRLAATNIISEVLKVRNNSLVLSLSHDPAPEGDTIRTTTNDVYLLSCFKTQNKMKSPRLLSNRSQLLLRWIAQIIARQRTQTQK
jgi:hypothetical protein